MSPHTHTFPFQLRCFSMMIPLSSNTFQWLLRLGVTQISFQQNACCYRIIMGSPRVANLAVSKAAPTFAQNLDREAPGAGRNLWGVH